MTRATTSETARAGGIVRAPRRPPGWRAPGPAPLGTQGRAELEPQADEDLCFLSGDWRLFQKLRGHRWSLDDLVTAWVAVEAMREAGVAPQRALDLGCGLGSVLLMLAWSFPSATVLGIEAQPARAALGRRSIAYNGAAARCQILDGDLRELGDREALASRAASAQIGAALATAPFQLITGTPPYFPRGTGTESMTPQVAPCRFELRGGVEAYLAAAAPLLAMDGALTVCTAALERERVAAAVRALGLRWRHHWEIVPRAGKPALVMVDVLGLPGPQPRDPEPLRHQLVVRDADGAWTPEFRAVRAAMGLPPTSPRGA